MNRRSVAVYFRSGRVYIHPMAFTEMGVLVAVEPFQEVELSLVGLEVRKLLDLEFGRVPHPMSQNLLQPLIEKANAKSWKDFAGKSVYLTVDRDGDIIRVKRWKWDGKGFSFSGIDANELPASCSNVELQHCLSTKI